MEQTLEEPSNPSRASEDWSSMSSLTRLNEAQLEVLEDLQHRGEALRMLLEEEHALAEDLQQAGALVEEEAKRIQGSVDIMLNNAAGALSMEDQAVLRVCLKAAAAHEDPDYEALIDNLTEDLQVVHTVPSNQVRPVVERWHGAIQKELSNLFDGGTLVEIDKDKAMLLERQGKLRLVPSKGVHTMKPPAEFGGKLKRKYRLVLCGNHAAPEESFGSLYAGGVSVESFRTVLALSAFFLLATWPAHLNRYAVVPPRILVEQGYASQNTFWLVLRPLYGLRESPAIWASYRSARLSSAKIPFQEKFLVLRASKVDSELWYIHLDNEETLLGCIITYVDDLFHVSEEAVICAVHAWVL